MYSIAIIDDDTLFLQQIKNSLHNTPYKFIGAYERIREFIGTSALLPKVDLLFLDVNIPEQTGIEGLPMIKKMFPRTEIIMLSVVESQDILLKALCLGAGGYLLKDSLLAKIEEYIEINRKGGSVISPQMARHLIAYFNPTNTGDEIKLSKKNLQVLQLLAEGWAYKTIASRLGISLDGVRYHIKEIYRALGVQSVGQAVRKYVEGDLPLK